MSFNFENSINIEVDDKPSNILYVKGINKCIHDIANAIKKDLFSGDIFFIKDDALYLNTKVCDKSMLPMLSYLLYTIETKNNINVLDTFPEVKHSPSLFANSYNIPTCVIPLFSANCQFIIQLLAGTEMSWKLNSEKFFYFLKIINWLKGDINVQLNLGANCIYSTMPMQNPEEFFKLIHQCAYDPVISKYASQISSNFCCTAIKNYIGYTFNPLIQEELSNLWVRLTNKDMSQLSLHSISKLMMNIITLIHADKRFNYIFKNNTIKGIDANYLRQIQYRSEVDTNGSCITWEELKTIYKLK